MTRTFIDSGVQIGAARNNEAAIRAFQVLNDAQRIFVTSDFVRLTEDSFYRPIRSQQQWGHHLG